MPSKTKDARPATFGQRLATLRERAGLTRNALAVRAKLSPIHLTRLELGQQEPGWGVVLRLAAALACSVEEFR